AVEHAGHADHALARQPGDLLHLVHHGVERIGNDDDECAGAAIFDLGADAANDLEVDGKQVVARHARLARHSGGDDDDVGAGAILPARGADHAGVVALDGGGLLEIERLALGQALLFGNVEKHDIAELAAGGLSGQLAADVAGADENYFGS